MSKKSSVDSDNYYLYPEWFEGGNGSNQSVPQPTSYGFYTIQASRKSPVASDNFCFYPDWFEGNQSNQSNQSQPSTSSYSYPTLEYIWSNAVRLTHATHSNLQDEIEYIEANLGGGGNLSCNCSELEYKIDINSTKIYYNSVNITSNANRIANLSDIKLSRDGSQPMEGELVCNSGLKTDIIKARTQSIIDCQNQLRVYQSLGGDGDSGLWLGSDFSFGAPSINLYPYASSASGKIFIKTPRSDGIVVPRIEIPGKEDLIDIKIWESNIIPYDDNYQDLGSGSNRWKSIYAISGNFSGTIIPDAILTNSANISDLDARVDYLEENLSTCNCSALQFGIDSNTTKIENLSVIKLSRDGSQSMTGLLKCESGLETNTITSYSGDTIECTDNLKLDGDLVGDSTDGLNLIAEDTTIASRIQLTPGSNSKILLGTFSGQSVVPRVEIPEGNGNVSITIRGAHLIPYIDNDQDLGAYDKRWKEIYAVKNIVSYIQVSSRIWSNSTFRIGHGTSTTEDTQIRFTSNDLTLMTPNSNGTSTERLSLTGNADRSIVYIKNAHLLPYDNLSSYLGSSAHRWVEVFANRGSFTHINAINESTLDIEDDVKIAQKLWGKDSLTLAGGDPTTGHSQIQIYNESYIGLPDGIKVFTTNTSKELEERVRIWGCTDYCYIYFGGDIVPLDDDVYSLGGPALRWSDIYAVNTHWGDLGFVEYVCPKCNKKFKIGDNIVLKVVRFSEEDGGIMTIPIHLECAKLPTIAIKRKYPVKEKYYEWDERQGKVIAKWRTKKQKKKIKKKRLKSGYKINQKTGKIETINRKNIELSEAIEEVEEEIEEIVYKEEEIKI